MLKAYAAYTKGHYEEAIATAEQTLATNPDCYEAWRLLSSSYRRLGRHDEATQAAQRWTKIATEDALAWYVLGLRLKKAGNAEGVIDAFKEAWRLGSAPAQMHCGKILMECGKVDEGLTLLRGAAESGQSRPAWKAYGNGLTKVQRFEEATIAFDHLSSIIGSNVRSHLEMGYLYLHSRAMAKARAAFQAALAAKPTSAEALYGLALCLEAEGDSSAARSFHSKAETLDPEHKYIRRADQFDQDDTGLT